jgi:hypothetical protein
MTHDANAVSTTLKLMCALVIRAPFDQVIVPAFEAAEHPVEIAWSPSAVIMMNMANSRSSLSTSAHQNW